MATLVAQKPTADAPAVLNFVAATAGGDQFTNTGRERLHVSNAGTAAVTVTVTAQKPCNQGFLHPVNPSVAAGATEFFGPFDIFRFNDATNVVHVTYDSVAGVTVALEG